MKSSCFFVACAAIVLFGFGCAPLATPTPGSDEAPTWLAWGEQTTLSIGETAEYKNLYVKLKSIEDSRCSPDVVCIWAGELAVVLEVQGGDVPLQEVRLGQTTAPTVTADGYVFVLNEVTTEEATISVSLFTM